MADQVTAGRFVGRTQELARLHQLLTRAIGGQPLVALLGGEAGVGKTRLVEQLAATATQPGVRVLRGGCVPLGEEGLPFAPVVEALRGLADQLDPAELAAVAGPARPELARLLPDLAWGGETAAGAAVAVAGQGRLFERLLGLVQRLATTTPLLWVVEDLHWADRSTRDLLAFLATTLRSGRVMVVLTFRSDELHRLHPLRRLLGELTRNRRVVRLELPRFTRAEVAQQLAGLLGDQPPTPLVDDLYARSDGNPFFAEELLLAGSDPGVLPPSLREVLLTRVVRLGSGTQRLLRVAAAAGPGATQPLLTAVAGMSDQQLLEGLREAVDQQLLRPEPGGDGYVFRHALLAEAVYGELLPGERVRLHTALAGALEAGLEAGGPPASRAARLAYHWAAAGDQPRALSASVQAAAAAEGVYAPAEAQLQLERALALWDRVPDAAEHAGMDRVALLARCAEAAYMAGNQAEAAELTRQAIALVDPARQPRRAGLLHEQLARCLRRLGDLAALGAHQQAVRLVPPQPSVERARVLGSLAQYLLIVDRFAELRGPAEEAIATAERVGARAEEANARTALGGALIYLGEPDAGLAELETAVRLATEAGDLIVMLRAILNHSDKLLAAGRLTEAATVALDGIQRARRLGLARSYGPLLAHVATEALAALGRWDQAEQVSREGLETSPSGPAYVALPLARAARLDQGRDSRCRLRRQSQPDLVATEGGAADSGSSCSAAASLSHRESHVDRPNPNRPNHPFRVRTCPLFSRTLRVRADPVRPAPGSGDARVGRSVARCEGSEQVAESFNGVINIDIRDSVPDWAPYLQPVAPEGAPNVVYIVLDDTGFSAMEPWGGLIETPNINKLAARGLTYTNWHTTALCSPTRSSLLTGRNHTTNGMACIAEATSGFPNANGHIPFECATIAEVLGERGWNTYMLGKWHLVAADEMNMASTKRNWPVGRGFERYYGFLGGETNQWYPDLVYDNHPVEQPVMPEDGYHLTTDLTDKAIEFIKDAKMIVPDKPFFMYFCPGATHAPHHAPKEWIEKYKGHFDMGYERYREQVFQRQKELGIFPEDAELSPLNPYAEEHSVDGKPWNAVDVVRPWDSLSEEEQRLFTRMAEVYAGFLSHTDHEIGRLLDFLEESGELDNTIVLLVSDNGASGEGGPNGSVNENKFFNGIPDDIQENLRYLEELGSPATYNHYPVGWAWAFNTPFKMWKRYNFEGGVADPLLISWPRQIKARGELRHQFVHATDLVPTIYDCLGVELPEVVKGFPQIPLEGVSLSSTFASDDVPTPKETGFFSMLGSRAIWHKGWKAVSVHPTIAGWGNFAHDRWELYHTDQDPTETHDLAAEHPVKLQELISLWFHEAGRYRGLPLEDRTAVEVLADPTRPQVAPPRDQYVYYPGAAEVPETAAANIRNRSYSIAVEVDIESEDAGGVLFSHGARFGGHSLYVKDRKLKYVYNFVGTNEQTVESTTAIPTGRALLSAAFVKEGDGMPTTGTLSLFINDEKVGEGRIMTQPGNFSLVGEGLNVGKDPGEPVTADYPGTNPFPFTGGTIAKAIVDVSGEPFIDLEKEAIAMMARE